MAGMERVGARHANVVTWSHLRVTAPTWEHRPTCAHARVPARPECARGCSETLLPRESPGRHSNGLGTTTNKRDTTDLRNRGNAAENKLVACWAWGQVLGSLHQSKELVAADGGSKQGRVSVVMVGTGNIQGRDELD